MVKHFSFLGFRCRFKPLVCRFGLEMKELEEEEQPAFEIGVVVPKKNVKAEDSSSDCVEVLVHQFRKLGFLVERVIGVADEFIKVLLFNFPPIFSIFLFHIVFCYVILYYIYIYSFLQIYLSKDVAFVISK